MEDERRLTTAVREDDGSIVVILDDDSQGLLVNENAVGHLDNDLVAVVSIGIGGILEVGGRKQRQVARRSIDAEEPAISPPRDRVGQCRTGIWIDRVHIRDGDAVFQNDDGCRRAPTIRHDGRCLGHVKKGYVQGLAIDKGAIEGLDGYGVDVVPVAVAKTFEVRISDERQGTSEGIYREQRRVGAAGQAVVDFSVLRIYRRDGPNRRDVFGMSDVHHGEPAIGRDLRWLVDDDIDHQLLLVGAALSITGLDDDKIDVVVVRIIRQVEVGTDPETDPAGD